jgi:hypothetical protein
MKHLRGIDLVSDQVEGFSIDHILAASAAAEKITFGDIPERYAMYARCKACGYETLVNRNYMIRIVGPHARVVETGWRLRCSRCKLRGQSHFLLAKIPR